MGHTTNMLKTVPVTLKEANEFVSQHHRHHKPAVGYKFAVGVADGEGRLVGVAIAGRPVSRMVDHKRIVEVTRLATDGTRNACSLLYSACARIAREMGYEHIQTYILESEPGTSLKAAGWVFDGMTAGGNWNHSWRKGRREDQPMCRKQRWRKDL